MKQLFSILFIATFMMAFVACQDDDMAPDGPAITPPEIINLQVNTGADVTFELTVPGGFKSYEATAVGGTTTKKSEPATGAKSGQVVVAFIADA